MLSKKGYLLQWKSQTLCRWVCYEMSNATHDNEESLEDVEKLASTGLVIGL